jgi:branched-chain amino acid aminotransferase
MILREPRMVAWSETWTFLDGDWHEGNVPMVGPRTHALWQGSSVFDGARAFEGVAPDTRLHFARVNRSAETLFLKASVDVDTWQGLLADGLKKFGPGKAVYVRPMYWAEAGGYYGVPPDPDSTRWCLCLYEVPMPEPVGISITLSPFRRPTLETMPTDAKAGCLYPNNARALLEARSRGFDNCLLRDMLGNIAETGLSNIFMARGGTVFTPAPNGTFLNGITRQRTIALFRAAGVEVVESSLTWHDFENADEIFSSGNYAKVMPVTRIDSRDLQPGPLYRKARALYWDYAHAG